MENQGSRSSGQKDRGNRCLPGMKINGRVFAVAVGVGDEGRLESLVPALIGALWETAGGNYGRTFNRDERPF
ncbi:hypothetical protein VIGAN_10232000 [Vigna angularis var. angularis]|uniref:Uncharacterized protein n=1 Tax=Vigna angularis var. angularis TaxID=157739 RepID=A0A0S3T727_PHAAN|nr:hypothetical protein VIGAN_10232000 [Vigna angularis var. angularis]